MQLPTFFSQVNEFGCYEAKIEESEKASSHRESDLYIYIYIKNRLASVGECRTLWDECKQVALNCYIAKALPVKYQITAHRL